MWLLVGLGNIGDTYKGTRHNAGFYALERVMAAYHISAAKNKFHGSIARGHIDSHEVLTLAPHTLMNRSGTAVGEAVRFYKILPQHIVVLHDDLDITLGAIRIKYGGGHGGHNGLRDIDRAIGPQYWRIRLGIGRPEHCQADISHYVLSRFRDDEHILLDQVVHALASHIAYMFEERPDKLTHAVHQAVSQ